MKKYKLIKEFPGSASLGTIYKEDYANGITQYDFQGESEFFEEVKEPQFKVGNWVVDSRDKQIFRITKIDGSNSERLFGSSEFEWLHSSYFRLATPQEIETHLIAEAKKRGFKRGAYHRWTSPHLKDDIRLVGSDNWRYNPNLECLSVEGSHSYMIYHYGEWAEIVKEEEIKIGEYEVKFLNGSDGFAISIGCKKYTHSEITSLYGNCLTFGINEILTHNHKVDFMIIKKIYEKIK